MNVANKKPYKFYGDSDSFSNRVYVGYLYVVARRSMSYKEYLVLIVSGSLLKIPRQIWKLSWTMRLREDNKIVQFLATKLYLMILGTKYKTKLMECKLQPSNSF